MRLAGSLSRGDLAAQFGNYLHGQQIDHRIDAVGNEFEVWIRNDDQLPDAQRALTEFQTAPAQAKFQVAPPAKQAPRPNNIIRMSDRWARPPIRRVIVTWFLLGMCVLVFLLQQRDEQLNKSIEPIPATEQRLVYQPRNFEVSDQAGQSPELFAAIRQGEIWRVLTPCLLHFGMMHIIFNMMMLLSYGPLIEVRRGAITLLCITLLTAAISNTAQYLFSTWWHNGQVVTFGGMSGVLCGWFGYCWILSRLRPAAGIFVDPSQVVFILLYLAICMTGAIGPIANAAHIAGLACGMAYAWGEVKLGRV